MELGVTDVLTVAGATVIVLILVGAVKATLPSFDSARFGALLSIIFGVLIVGGANATAIADVRLDWATAVLTGILAGASASGLYDTAKGVSRTVGVTGIVAGIVATLAMLALLLALIL